ESLASRRDAFPTRGEACSRGRKASSGASCQGRATTGAAKSSRTGSRAGARGGASGGGGRRGRGASRPGTDQAEAGSVSPTAADDSSQEKTKDPRTSGAAAARPAPARSEEHTSELQSLAY